MRHQDLPLTPKFETKKTDMEYQIDEEDQKKVQVQTVDNDLVLILSHDDVEIYSRMYNDLKNHTDQLSQALVKTCLCQDDVDCNVSLGNDLYAYVKSPFRCVQIRQFFECDAVMLPTKTGISLERKQWSSLLDIFNAIDKAFCTPKPAKCQELHQNQEDIMMCPDCCPAVVSPTQKMKKRTTDTLPMKKRLFDE